MEQTQGELLSELKTDVKWIKNTLQDLNDDLPKKYAAKWTQNVVTFVLSTAGVAIIGALLGLILISPTRAFLAMIVGI